MIVLNKFLYKPVLKIIQDRQKEIDSGLKLKEEMEEKVESLAKDRENVLKKARIEAQKFLEQKKQEAGKVREKIISDAREEKEEMVASGKREIEANRKEMEKLMQQDVLEIAFNMTQKVLKDTLKKKDHETIIRSQLEKLSKTNS